MLARPPADDRKRERKARYLRRQAAGLTCFQVVAHEHKFADALMRSGRLTPDQALHHSKIERALALIVAEFIERWGRVP